MLAEFSFFKAGQGLFYGGRIWKTYRNQIFTVVYDCGTSPFIPGNNQSLNKEIDYFKKRKYYIPNNNKNIDLLFISHLDYDHVSGLKRLLNEFEVKRIILPYIEMNLRKFILTSISDNNEQEKNLTVDEYISFIESPFEFINNNSKDTLQFYVKSDEKKQEYIKNEFKSENIYPNGTMINNIEELTNKENVFVYENDLQFFIEQNWEFTIYAKSINQNAINKLHACFKSILKKQETDNLTFEDIKNIVTKKRKESHKCYTENIDEVNSYGLVLLHGPIHFQTIYSRIYPNFCLRRFNSYTYHNQGHDYYNYYDKNPIPMLGTLLLSDISINPNNNPIDFPQYFKEKLENVHLVQVPHHGSSKNWDLKTFEELKIGAKINRWKHRVFTVCNFGFGNKFGHPSHQVLNDLQCTIFLNTQFSRLNILYEIFY
jgi:hypothetical protein